MKNPLLTVRVSRDLIARLNQHCERLKLLSPGASFTVSDCVRMLIWTGLNLAEQEDKQKKAQ